MSDDPATAAPPHLAGGMPASAGQLILERRRRLVGPLLPDPCGLLVDFGCGNGAQTLRFLDRCDQLVGVDVNEAFLGDFRASLAAAGLQDRVQALSGAGGPAPLPDGCADAVICFTVLEHVPDEAATLAELRRLLRPGGRLVLTVPNRWWLFETHGADLPLLPWNRVPLVSWWPKPLHDRFARARIYTRADIRRLLAEAGFHVDDCFHLTAPMDMIRWAPLRDLVRRTVFRGDRTVVPVLATEIVVAATR